MEYDKDTEKRITDMTAELLSYRLKHPENWTLVKGYTTGRSSSRYYEYLSYLGTCRVELRCLHLSVWLQLEAEETRWVSISWRHKNYKNLKTQLVMLREQLRNTGRIETNNAELQLFKEYCIKEE